MKNSGASKRLLIEKSALLATAWRRQKARWKRNVTGHRRRASALWDLISLLRLNHRASQPVGALDLFNCCAVALGNSTQGLPLANLVIRVHVHRLDQIALHKKRIGSLSIDLRLWAK